MTGEGAIYDTVAAQSLQKLPVAHVANGNGCGLYGAVTSDQQTGKVFFAEFNTITDLITVISFDSQTLKQLEQVTVPAPTGLPFPYLGGPTRLVRISNTNAVALVTDLGYIVALQGSMFAP
jgi:hypothetical protein